MQYQKLYPFILVVLIFQNMARTGETPIPWPPSVDLPTFDAWINTLKEGEKIAAFKKLYFNIEDTTAPGKKFDLKDGKLFIESTRVNANDLKWISEQTHCTGLYINASYINESFFTSLGNFNQLSELSIQGSIVMDQAGLDAISKIKTLKTLTLSGSDEKCLKSFSRLPYLEKVNIHWPISVTDDAIGAFAQAPNLHYLYLLEVTNKNGTFTGEGLASLTQLQSLEINDSNGFGDNQALFNAVSFMRNLRRINISLRGNNKTGDQDLAPLEKIKSFEEFRLSGLPKLDGSFFKYLGNSKALSKLELSHIDGSKLDFCSLSHVHNLTYLRLNDITQMTEESWQSISCLENLETLDMSSVPNAGTGPSFSMLNRLSKMFLNGCGRLDSSFFKNLSNAVNLQSLSVDSIYETSSKDLVYLKNLKKLNVISFKHCSNIDDGLFDILGTLQELKSLSLWNMPKLTGKGIGQLAKTKIETLEIMQLQVEDWQLSSEVVNEILNLTRLETLEIEFRDELSKDNIEKLKKLPSIKKVYVSGMGMKPEQAPNSP